MKKLFMIRVVFMAIVTITSCGKQSDNKYFVENQTVVTDEYSMPAKLTIPKSNHKVPGVVMVHGSGANNMNESIGKLNLFKDLSEQLGDNGIASIRYDKRVFTYLDKISKDYSFTIYDEVIDDAISALKILKNDVRIDENNLFIVGHSFGGQLAPVIANVAKEEGINIKGVISLAGTTEHIIDLTMR